MQSAARSDRLGPYLIGDRIGLGGMAEVYSARGPGGELLALKRILPGLAADPEFCEMFADEARILSRLAHPSIVRVLEWGSAQNELYMALEFVDGPNLARVLRRSAKSACPTPWPALISMGLELLGALDFVHSACDEDGRPLGIVHRDVSPGNLMLTSAGRLKLGDFGIVRSEVVARRTQPGELKGKIGYMSPEQASGAPVDQRSDLFSVGIVLAEFCMLRPLFLGKNEMATLGRTASADLSTWRRFHAGVPEPLRAVIERALERDPRDRYQTAREMRRALWGAAQRGRIEMDDGCVRTWLAQMELVDAPEKLESGERPVAPAQLKPPPLIPCSSGSSQSLRAVAVSPLGLPTLRRGRPVWTLETSTGALPHDLTLALRRAPTGGVEIERSGQLVYLELRGGRIVAAHDSSGAHALGRLLREESIIDSTALAQAIGESRKQGLRLGEYLVVSHRLRESALARLLREQLKRRLAQLFEPSREPDERLMLSVLVLDAPAPDRPRVERRLDSSAPEAQFPEAVAQLISALRRASTASPERGAWQPDERLGAVLDSVVLPARGAADPAAIGLTAPEVRALRVALEGGALEGRTFRFVLDTLVEERLAQRKEAEFAYWIGLITGLIHASGLGHRK